MLALVYVTQLAIQWPVHEFGQRYWHHQGLLDPCGLVHRTPSLSLSYVHCDWLTDSSSYSL